MKRGVFRRGMLFIVGTFLLGLATAWAGPVKVRIASQMPAEHFVTKAIDQFIAEATKLSNNTLEFTHYPSQQLYKDTEIPDVLPKGGVEMAQINGYMFVGKVKEVAIGSIPAAFDDLNHFYRYYLDSPARDVMDKALREQANIMVLCSLLYSPNNCVLTIQPITKIEDYQGKKIRGWGKVLSVILQSWGASGVVMSSSDVYMALERGTIDGAFTGMTSFWARKWYEPAKYINEMDGLLPAPFNLAANQDFWNKLTPDQKKAILTAAYHAEISCTKASVATWDKAKQGLESKGVKVFDWPKDQAQKLKDLARPACYKALIEEPLGKDMLEKVKGWVAETRNSSMTWEESCKKAYESRLSQVK